MDLSDKGNPSEFFSHSLILKIVMFIILQSIYPSALCHLFHSSMHFFYYTYLHVFAKIIPEKLIFL